MNLKGKDHGVLHKFLPQFKCGETVGIAGKHAEMLTGLQRNKSIGYTFGENGQLLDDHRIQKTTG
jgi:hypothetical protein